MAASPTVSASADAVRSGVKSHPAAAAAPPRDISEEDEEGMMGGRGGGSGGTPKKRRGARQYLDDEKVRRLDEIGFTWAFKKVTKSWEERFEDLVQFRSENGHCNVPRGFGSLGEWVSCDVCHVDVLSN